MIDDFARILYAGTLPGLGAIGYTADGFKKWISSGAFTPFAMPDGRIRLERVGIDEFTRALSFDYDRFALSAHESRIVAMSEREKFGAVGWPILKQYYSAFFSAHAIMRARGAGVSRIDEQNSRAITSILQTYAGDAVRFSSGTYYFSVEAEPGVPEGELTVSLSAARDGRGVHEGFWAAFVSFLEAEAKQAVNGALPDNREFLAYADEVRQSICFDGGIWLTKIRNAINYQHDFDSWMPLTARSISNRSVPKRGESMNSFIRLDVSKKDDPIRSFFCVCSYLSELNFLIANRVASRSKAGGTFGQRWHRLVSMTKAAA